MNAVVCDSCSRDIAAPEFLIAELDELLRRRDAAHKQLSGARNELTTLKRAGEPRPA